ncbi:AMP-binding protein [Alkalihalophilus lindianensis]|uniref:AMP-binding protein n=1 Tax=Alkalihalophilus lindianensis TaxID=1630542 RepID=A0ABU3XF89_9BACI|nr:AMP-binding protein [Alkalihalophilus lindianensis]MDV2686555.1 AMP-binding protein [Alkalihalophilus lindianensis]
MIIVNDQYYSYDDLEDQFASFEQQQTLRECKKKRIAVCHDDAFILLALCLYIRKKGGSIVPLHATTPLEGAVRIAIKTDCHYLFYQQVQDPVILNRKAEEKRAVLVQLSSGTTGDPKCIERTWSSIEEELNNYNVRLNINMVTTSIVACPINHSYGLISGVLAAMKRGSTPVIITNLNPKYILKKLKEFPIHLLYAAPTLLYTLLMLLSRNDRFYAVMSSGTKMPEAWLKSLKEVSGRVLQQYGCSEAGCVSINANLDKPEEIGRPLSHISIESGGSKDEPREIILYTSEQIIHTKDMGYFDEQGNLHFVERMDDMINVAGLNVYPHEIENVIRSYKGICDVVVYKKVDPYALERVCANYISEEPIEPSLLRAWCKKKLAPYQVPIEWIQVEKIERMANGKVNRKQLGGIYR